MKMVVTGASGFIGQHLVPLLLLDGHELLIVSRNGAPAAAKQQTVAGDLKNLDPIKQRIIDFAPETCLHLAWEGLPDYSFETSRSNLEQSIRWIQFLTHETACRKIIVSGSSWEYGKPLGVCTETDETLSTSYFTWAKNAVYSGGSLLCAPKGIDFVWLRIFFAFGPGQKPHSLIPTLHKALKQGQKPDIRTPHNAQDFIYVTDVAEAFRAAVQAPLPSGIYNIGRETPVAVSEICERVQQQLQKTATRTDWPAGHPTVRNWADTAKFRKATGWQPQVSLEQGIKNHIEFMEIA